MSNQANSCLALTIGPIVESLLSARKTRELWGSSYLFSYVVRNIITVSTKQISDYDVADKSDFNWNKNLQPLKKDNLLLPTTGDEGYTFGAGLYPDRIYFLSNNIENDCKQLNQSIDKVIWDLAAQIKNHVNSGKNNPGYTFKDIGDFLKNYFRINVLEVKLDNNVNIVNTITPYLDASEQHPRLTSPETIGNGTFTLSHFLDKVNGSFLFWDGFWKPSKRNEWVEQLIGDDKNEYKPLINEMPRVGFKSLIEIATTGLRRSPSNIEDKYKRIIDSELEGFENPDDDMEVEIENNIISKFRKEENFKKEWRAYHKYVTVVHVDGDNVGKIIGKVAANPDQLKEFSTRLRQFAVEAVKQVVKYGGSPVYAGGDDLLFFAPVACIQKTPGEFQTIFNLIENLDAKFKDKLATYAESIEANFNPETNQPDIKLLPSLTYGLSINYYKYPLYEARNASFELMENIKNECHGEKNAIGVKFLKHSGQKISFTIRKHRTETWKAFQGFLKSNIPNDANMLNSLTHRLEDLWLQLKLAEGSTDTLTSFFNNNFNENWNKYKDFYSAIIDLIVKCWKESSQDEKNEDYGTEKSCWLDPVYGALRFVQFIKSKDKGDE
jgi:CRISPR-associated protein Cmr2